MFKSHRALEIEMFFALELQKTTLQKSALKKVLTLETVVENP